MNKNQMVFGSILFLAVAQNSMALEGSDSFECSANILSSNHEKTSLRIETKVSQNEKTVSIVQDGQSYEMYSIDRVQNERLKNTKKRPSMDFEVLRKILIGSQLESKLPVDYFDAHYLFIRHGETEKLNSIVVDAYKSKKLQFRFITDGAQFYGICD